MAIQQYSGLSVRESGLKELHNRIWDEVTWDTHIEPRGDHKYCEIKVKWKHYSYTRKFDTSNTSINKDSTLVDWIAQNQNDVIRDVTERLRDGVWR